MATLIPAEDQATLWALIAAGTAVAIWLEQTYRWAARLSAPVLALLIAMLLSNLRVVPADAPTYGFAGDWLVPLALPLLLFRADIREIVRVGGRVFLVFHLSAAGTLLGTVVAVLALKGAIGAPDTAYAAGMMAGSYMGGGVNFLAVQQTHNVPPEIAGSLVVADNFVMAAFFVALLGIGASRWFQRRYPHPHVAGREADAGGEEAAANLAAQHWRRKEISLLDLARAFAFAAGAVAVAGLLGRGMEVLLGDLSSAGGAVQALAFLATNKFVLLTAVSLTMATVFAGPMRRVNGPEELGAYLLALFLFTLGLPADLVSVLADAPLYFLFCGIIAAVNLAFTLVAGKLLKCNLEELLLAVNANLGGAPTAAAMAISAGWPKLVLPGILVGVWGYVVGTPVGLMVVRWLL